MRSGPARAQPTGDERISAAFSNDSDTGDDQPDESLTAQSRTLNEQRIADISACLAGELHEGEEFVVRCEDGELEVTLPNSRLLAQSEPELYGTLASAQQRLDDAGSGVIWLVRLALLFVMLGLHLRWVENIGQVNLEKFRSGWVYLFLLLCGYVINSWIAEKLEYFVYRSLRPSLLAEVERSGLGVNRVITKLDDDMEFSAVIRWLKREQEGPRY